MSIFDTSLNRLKTITLAGLCLSAPNLVANEPHNRNGDPVVLLDSVYDAETSCGRTSGCYAYFRVKTLVKNLAYEKDVTVVYTINGWRYRPQTCGLFYSHTLENGYEVWSALCRSSGQNANVNPEEVEFAVVAHMGGTSYWDNNYGQNHRVFPSN